jgi:drug/metabolite transporter (DMT)-like permease
MQSLKLDRDCVMSDTPNEQGHLKGKPTNLSTESYGLGIIALSAFMYSAMGAFVKLVTQNGVPSTELVFIRAAFQGVLVIMAMLWFQELPESTDASSQASQPPPRLLIFAPLGNSTNRHIVIARGAVGGCGFLLFFYTVSVLPLGDATALLSLSPVVTVLASAAVFGEPLRGLHIAAAISTVLGSFLIARPNFLYESQTESTGTFQTFGYLTACLATCTQAGVFILMRKAGRIGAHTLQLLFSWVLFGLIFSILLGVILPLGEGRWALPKCPLTWAYIAGCCCFGVVAHFCLNFAGRHTNPGLASIMRSSGIMWAFLLQIFVFGNVPTAQTSFGVALICISLLLVSAQKLFDSKVLPSEGPTTVAVNEESRLLHHSQQTR